MIRIGLISDTHGLLRHEALAALRGCDHIVHAGDIGPRDILASLAGLAPLAAVRGNNDREAWANALPLAQTIEFGATRVHVLHDLATLAVDPVADGIHVVVSGHSHRPVVRRERGVLYVNPGSAGPRRFRLPIALGELLVDGAQVEARIVELATA